MAIGNSAFEGCTSLKCVDIPASVEKIGETAFRDCSSLKSIEIHNLNIEIGNEAFNNTEWYESQPNGTIYINKALYKYKGNVNETSIGIKKGTSIICACAFKGCTFLESIYIPDSIRKIDKSSFKGCTSLKVITLPESVLELGEQTFRDYY